ncbi:MAG: hypothetical protein J6M31_08655 [Bacteroidales bacterium]|nr:hypothetical protein [Bacteroidales bacterium]
MSHARIIDSFSIPNSRPRASALLPNTQHYRVLVEAEKTAVIGSGFVPEYV